MSSPYVITLPAVDDSVNVTVQAFNDFGTGGLSLAAQDVISKSLSYFFGAPLILHFIQQGNWLTFNCCINHFYAYDSCILHC